MSEIKNKTVLITGGASGIGKLMGELCLQEGAQRLIIWDVDRKKTEETAAGFQSKGFEVHTYHVDVSNVNEIVKAAADVKQRWGGVDLLFNNAGILNTNKFFYEQTHREVAATMSINANGPMHVALEFIPAMIEKQRGHIINIASAAGMLPNPRLSVYCSSKHAVIGWSESIRLELQQFSKNIRVTTVTPSYIGTGLITGVRSPVIPIVQPLTAAKKIIGGVKRNKIYVRTPFMVYAIPFVKGILPQKWMNIMVGKWFGFHKSMDGFTGKN
jgi:NAD(P)-dependent dehydrogenase (short-subunit alcohol dehydrogenase family)